MKVGEKYVIEIDKTMTTRELELPMGTHTILAKIKGFNSLVFDENGLSKLEKLEDVIKEECDRAREEGRREGYELAFTGVKPHDGCEGCKYELCDGDPCTTCKGSYVDKYKPKEEKTVGIQKYDICKMHGIEYCVTQIYSSCGDTFLDLIDKTGAVYSREDAILFTKVGHIDSLDKWLE